MTEKDDLDGVPYPVGPRRTRRGDFTTKANRWSPRIIIDGGGRVK